MTTNCSGCNRTDIRNWIIQTRTNFELLWATILENCPDKAIDFDDTNCDWEKIEYGPLTPVEYSVSYMKGCCPNPDNPPTEEETTAVGVVVSSSEGGRWVLVCDEYLYVNECSHIPGCLDNIATAITQCNISLAEVVEDAQIHPKTVNRIRVVIQLVADNCIVLKNASGCIDGGDARETFGECYEPETCGSLGIKFTPGSPPTGPNNCGCPELAATGCDARINAGDCFVPKHFQELASESAKLLNHAYCWCCECEESSSEE